MDAFTKSFIVITDFGFLDGISNPAVTGFATKVLPGQSLVPAGIILAGRTGDTGIRPSWALDGSFLVRMLFPPTLISPRLRLRPVY
jgi:hypothetical protein